LPRPQYKDRARPPCLMEGRRSVQPARGAGSWPETGELEQVAGDCPGYQARGADKIITENIDAHVEAERGKRDDDDGAAGVLVPVG